MKTHLKILNSNSKWTTIVFDNCNARSRISTPQLKEQFMRKEVDLVNPSFLEGTNEK